MQGVINLKGKKAEAEVRTNVMRLLDAAGIHYETGTYEVDENDLSGSHAADLMGIDHDQMYKTLVLKGEKKGYLVCCIPVDEELDKSSGREESGDDPRKRYVRYHRLHPGRLFSNRNEEKISNIY